MTYSTNPNAKPTRRRRKALHQCPFLNAVLVGTLMSLPYLIASIAIVVLHHL